MKLSFLGAAQMVTGSNYLLNTKEHNIVIDCGMFQGNQETEKLNYREFPFDPASIDILILTHAHIDHSGRIPKMVKEGFRGKIISTKATFDLCGVMLLDSAKIQENDAQWENKKRERRGEPEIEPLYTIDDAEHSLKYFEPQLYEQKIDINGEISMKFKDAGHILGSSILELWVTEDEKTTKLVFSGDLGMPNRPIIRDPQYVDEADYLVIESTYGDTDHPPMKESAEKLIEIINKTAKRGGTVLIPSFAVGRTQELIYQLNKYYEYNDIKLEMEIPIYIDSPMATNATEVFQNNSGTFDQETQDLILKGDNPFLFKNLHYVRTVEESMALNDADFPKVIISASGMATAGRIRHHLKHNLWDPKNSLIFVGYQAEGSLGRILLDGVKKVKLLGEEIHVGLEIYDLEGFSAHADRKFMLDWIDKIEKKPRKVFIVHGEKETAEEFSRQIEDRFGLQTIIPKLGNCYRIARDSIEVEKGISIEPAILKEEIAKELQNVYEQFNSLMSRSNGLFDEDLLEKDYDLLKNRLLELQNQLMDLNMLIGK
ncbi:MBL fold metallo-hydrolase RNA specificity domain-containing protein [Gudongella sp. DL1XJH-153]|uniref:MBL fold metallo-hydrolase RNA specificity domain-containing protein n=1 Tax=Gudongella sp. DL1XJH-153 TaxID=3409804 RepID=UPI003BB75F6D